MCVCVGSYRQIWRNWSSTEITWELDGSPVPCAKARRCVDRARACRKQMNTRSAGEQTNRTDMNRSNTSPVLRLGMDMLTLSRSHGKTDQTNNKKHLLLEHRATPGQLPHQPTATCSGGPGESCNGERGKSGQLRQQHQQQELHQYRLQIVEAIPCFTHGCTWRRPNCPAFGAYLLSNEQCRSAVLHKWWNERDNEARQSPHNLRKEYEYPLKLWDSAHH